MGPEKSAATRAVSLSQRFSRVAAMLMDADGVRLYQDSIFWKKAGDAGSLWHLDQSPAPFAEPHRMVCVTPSSVSGLKF